MGSVTPTSRERHIYKGREADKVGKSKHLTSEQRGMVKFANLAKSLGVTRERTRPKDEVSTVRDLLASDGVRPHNKVVTRGPPLILLDH